MFRAPAAARAYAVLHGAGAQFFLLVSLTLAFAALGFLSPSNRELARVKCVGSRSVTLAQVDPSSPPSSYSSPSAVSHCPSFKNFRSRVLYSRSSFVTFWAAGIIAGYVAARLCKAFKEGAQFQITMAVTLAVPGVFFIVFFIVNSVRRFRTHALPRLDPLPQLHV